MLERHSVWEYVLGADTLQTFQKNIVRPIYLNPLVPPDITQEIDLVEKLLLHSFYEYEFIDIALTQAIFAVEKALRIRNEELGNMIKQDASFQTFHTWFLTNNYFETDNIEVLNQLRKIRNNKAHNKTKSLGGLAFISNIYHAIDLINDIYEDSDLRRTRKDIKNSLNKKLADLTKEGIILSVKDKRTIIFNARVIFVDNKQTDAIYHIGFSPIFDPTPYKTDSPSTPPGLILNLNNLIINGEEITAQYNGEIVSIKKIDDNNRVKFDQWQTDVYSLPNYPMILYLTTEPWEKYYQNCVREFHKK